jgi:hypothetical protein
MQKICYSQLIFLPYVEPNIYTMKTKDQFRGMRWTARILGTLLVVFTLFMAIGETIDDYNRTGKLSLDALDPIDYVTFFFWFLGLAGIIWALWREKTGGFLALISLFIFLILVTINTEATFSVILLIYLIPPILFVSHWWLTDRYFRHAGR